MPEQSGGEKTLPASQRKRERAREQGNVAKSQDLTAAWMLLLSLLALWFLGGPAFASLVRAMGHFMDDASGLLVTRSNLQALSIEALWYTAQATLPLMTLLLIAGLAINVAQVGFLFAPQAIAPKLDKLNPITGFQKFFTLRAFVELVKSFVKLALVSYIVYWTFRGRWEQLLYLPQQTPLGVTAMLSDLVFAVWWRVVLAMIVLGLLDYLFQRWQHEQDLRMTVQEAREETRELEGDPRIKQRIRQIQRQMAMRRMMAEVPKAEVVITNPTRYAVALRYNPREMDAPVVVAKGARRLAERIRELAVTHDVPIVERPELARLLYRTIEVGQVVPENLFRAVAEVLAFVYQIDRRVAKVQERTRIIEAVD
ncbi:MAG: flagellar biosynthesis protein FlhB [Candidatus Hydrogenedentes bacterium]|nr:flagellar biosynthesis protein FlhB [Candidatus Hydrogenedentota bacterium]